MEFLPNICHSNISASLRVSSTRSHFNILNYMASTEPRCLLVSSTRSPCSETPHLLCRHSFLIQCPLTDETFTLIRSRRLCHTGRVRQVWPGSVAVCTQVHLLQDLYHLVGCLLKLSFQNDFSLEVMKKPDNIIKCHPITLVISHNKLRVCEFTLQLRPEKIQSF